MRLGGIVLGTTGLALALAATWFTAWAPAAAARPVSLAALSCLVGLLALWVAVTARPRLGAVLLVESLLGLLVALGQQALVPGVFLLAAAALVGLTPPPDRRLRGSVPRSPLRIG